MKAISRLVLTLLLAVAVLSCGNKSEAQKNTINGHEYVDLGLSVVWATCNVGGSAPEDYGDYYAWGETSTKSEYTMENSKTAGIALDDIGGDSKYDAARANWGATWRLPTKAEMKELEDKCEWVWTTINGHSGYKVSGPSGQSIFLPAAGFMGSNVPDNYVEIYGSYWISTSSIHSILEDDDDTGDHLVFYNEANRAQFDFLEPISIVEKKRFVGLSIRPVSVRPSKNDGGDNKSQSSSTEKKSDLIGELAGAIAKKQQADSIKSQKALQIREETKKRREASKKKQVQYTLSDLLARPFGSSRCAEISSIQARVDELVFLESLDFKADGMKIELVDTDAYPRLFGMTLTKAEEGYRDDDEERPGKTVLWFWNYEYESSASMAQSQADNIIKELIETTTKLGGHAQVTSSSDAAYEILGWLDDLHLGFNLKRQADKKYKLSIYIVEQE